MVLSIVGHSILSKSLECKARWFLTILCKAQRAPLSSVSCDDKAVKLISKLLIWLFNIWRLSLKYFSASSDFCSPTDEWMSTEINDSTQNTPKWLYAKGSANSKKIKRKRSTITNNTITRKLILYPKILTCKQVVDINMNKSLKTTKYWLQTAFFKL